MKLRFSKMHGLGNDFVVIDACSQQVALTPQQIRRIADRHFGVGCDQLLLVEPSSIPDAHFRYRIFNADGGEVEQCGNGARCFVRFVHDHGLATEREIRVQTACGIITPRLETDGLVTVDMGAPRFAPTAIPFHAEREAATYTLDVAGEPLTISALSMGNPHAVQIVDEHHIRLRVFERGSGETLACGTGACAAVVAGIQLGRLQSPVRVMTRGGELLIRWEGAQSPVWMTGPAATVFEGELDTDTLTV